MLALFLMAAGTLDHAAWDALLKRYVNPEHRVDYQTWKARDVASLDAYLGALAERWPRGMSANEEKAALINAYNALTIRWVLKNYPVKSIWKTKQPFRAARHTLNGEKISLDAIEGRLRAMGDPRIHAALVCAARSCPPLRREAYTAARLDEQLDDNARQWLENPRLNTFDAGSGKAGISMIFKWYSADFEAHGGVKAFLEKYGPPEASKMRSIDYRAYRWGLNDTTSLGEDYGGLAFYWDPIWNR
ncbi:MAG: DUF547 domain-containing protein [Bryobacterales bacterium]|nr:DUF547 domain-containing protein [Bryobacterales bacterium]